MPTLFALDTETTGLKSKEGDRIIEIALVEITRNPNPRAFHRYANPGDREIAREATEVHGLTADFLKDKPAFEELIPDMLDFIGDDGDLVIHNAPFDLEFLRDEFTRLNMVWPEYRVIDTLKEAIKHFPGSRHSLDALCNRFGIDLSVRTKHSALIDSQLLAQVYLAWFGQTSLNLVAKSTIVNPDQIMKAVSFNPILVEFPEDIKDNPPSNSWDKFFQKYIL